MAVAAPTAAFADQVIQRYERVAQPTVSYTVQPNELGVVNFQTVWGDKEANIESMDEYIEEAEALGVKLLLFPEMCVTGYASSSNPNSEIYQWAIESAETKDGPTAAHFADLADDYDMWIVYGATEVVPDGAPIPFSFNGGVDDGYDHAYNSIFACSPTGEVTTYQKITPVEGSWCLPGVTPVMLDARSSENLGLGLIGLSICYDTYATPEIGRYYAAKGANFLLNPTATSRSYSDVDGDGERDPQGWEWYYRNRLESNADREGFKILSANIVGGDGPQRADGSYTYNFPGGSVILGSNATYYGGIEDSSMLGVQYASRYPEQTPKLITATEGLVTNGVRFTAGTGSTVRDLDFAPELYALWYKDLADQMKAGNDLSYTYSYAAGTTDDSAGYENFPVAAVANMIGVWGDAEATIREMDYWVEEAAKQDVDFLLFPETVLTGYGWVDPALDSFEDDDRAMQVITAELIPGGATTRHFEELAQKHDMIIIIGMCEQVDEKLFERVESGTYAGQVVEKIYNSAAIMFPDGSETLSYRKTQRAGSSSSTGEGQWSVTGDGPLMFETKWGKVGIDICRDGHFYPEEGRYMAASGCNIFFHITATTGGPWYRETRIGSYTDRDGMAAVTANLLGLDGMPQVRDIVVDEDGNPVRNGQGNLTYTAWRPATDEDTVPFVPWVPGESETGTIYDIAGYQAYQTSHPTTTADPEKARLFQFSYGAFNSTSLILTPYHNAAGRKSFDPVTGYGLDLNGTGPESDGFASRRTSPHGLEVATMNLSGTGFSTTNFNPDLFSHMYDELAVLYREGYVSIYGEPEPEPEPAVATLSFEGASSVVAGSNADYTVSLAAIENLANLTVTVDASDNLEFMGAESLIDGVSVIESFVDGDGAMKVVLGAFSLPGLSLDETTAVLKLSYKAIGAGPASAAVTLVGADAAVYLYVDGGFGGTDDVETVLPAGGAETVTTGITEYVDPYDFNRDGQVSLADLSFAQVYYRASATLGGDAWTMVLDRGIDVDASGEIDVADFILTINHIYPHG
jgi:predicted amidohydrolase